MYEEDDLHSAEIDDTDRSRSYEPTRGQCIQAVYGGAGCCVRRLREAVRAHTRFVDRARDDGDPDQECIDVLVAPAGGDPIDV